jgi:xanthine dehydrogenase YagS FAD-binding subunit
VTPFSYTRANDVKDAVRLGTGDATAFLGGGTNLVDLMRETVARPGQLVDVTGLSNAITETADGGLLIGAAVRNTALAEHHAVRARYPVLSHSILAGASGQIRNMATVGGNLLQRTRCTYFYDTEGSRCNKRTPGTGCDARQGFNRIHAILGASDACVATHPSDMCVALTALDVTVHIEGRDGARTLAFGDLHRLPGDRPDLDTVLAPGELITAIALPPLGFAARSTYRKVRDRASYAFALRWTATGSATSGSRSAASRTSPGARPRRRPRCAAHRPPKPRSARRRPRSSPTRGRFATMRSSRNSRRGPWSRCWAT